MSNLEVYKDAMDKISSSDVLEPEDMLRLLDLTTELKHAMATQTIFRTSTEAITSVLNDIKHPTAASKYHQAKLEQLVMFQNLMELSFAYQEAQIDLAENEDLQQKLSENSDQNKIYELQRTKIKHDRISFRLSCMRNEAKERLREIEMWSAIKKSLQEAEQFDSDNKDTDQLRSLTLRYLRELPAALRAGNDVGGAVNIIAQAATMLAECERRGIALDKNIVERSKRLLKGA
jgi:hypothetical protein